MSDLDSDYVWEEVASVKTSDSVKESGGKEASGSADKEPAGACGKREEKKNGSAAEESGSSGNKSTDLKEALRKSREAASPSRRLVNRLLLILVITLGIALLAAAVIFIRILSSLP